MHLQGRDLEQYSTLLWHLIPGLIPLLFLQLIHQLIHPLWVMLKYSYNNFSQVQSCRTGLSALWIWPRLIGRTEQIDVQTLIILLTPAWVPLTQQCCSVQWKVSKQRLILLKFSYFCKTGYMTLQQISTD